MTSQYNALTELDRREASDFPVFLIDDRPGSVQHIQAHDAIALRAFIRMNPAFKQVCEADYRWFQRRVLGEAEGK